MSTQHPGGDAQTPPPAPGQGHTYAAQQYPPPGYTLTPTEPPKKKSWFRRHKLLTLLLGLLALGLLINLTNGGDEADTTTTPGTAAGSSAAAPASAPTGGATDEAAPAASTAAEPAQSEQPTQAAEKTEEEAKVATVGDTVTAGAFEYTVTKVTPGVKLIGDPSFGERPQGEFVLVELTVKNTGDKAELFNDSDQKLVDTEGREHSSDSGAAIHIENNDAWLAEINPGNTLKGTIVFDLPKGAKGKELKLKGPGFWSQDEVIVSLG